MDFVPAKELMASAVRGGWAVPSFCVWNAETMATVLSVARDCRAPVMLMNGPGEFPLLPPARMAAVARTIAADFDVPAALHLDHGDSHEVVNACLLAGYTSVMLDFSTRPYEENVAALQQVVAKAGPLGVTVEGEIGHVGKVDDVTVEATGPSTLTEPADAARYAEQTGVDALAVSIGNAHGTYTRLPRFDFDRLAAIRQAAGIPLVLHGGSGTPDDDLRRAIGMGVAKVNVATELVNAFRDELLVQWREGNRLWLPSTLVRAMEIFATVVERWIRLTGAEGKA